MNGPSPPPLPLSNMAGGNYRRYNHLRNIHIFVVVQSNPTPRITLSLRWFVTLFTPSLEWAAHKCSHHLTLTISSSITTFWLPLPSHVHIIWDKTAYVGPLSVTILSFGKIEHISSEGLIDD